MKIKEDIFYVGVNDRELDLFEGQYIVPEGMAYNSYVIVDEKCAVLDTVSAGFGQLWLEQVKEALGGRRAEYLVVHHMEPDHSSNITLFTEEFPEAKIVASKAAFAMMKNFYGADFAERRIVVGEGDRLELGKHTLSFLTAPMVHWPEVIVSYDEASRTLFSADAFGKFGALDAEEDWACEARRYYVGIVGKYGAQVQALLKKASALEIDAICPLHGPILTENLDTYLNLYDTWSSYRPEEEGVLICYTSVYGNTKRAVEELAAALEERGCPKVVVNDLARCDMAEAVEDAFRYSKLVLATTTYNGEIFPFMREFIHHLTERNFAGRKIALIENGSWAPTAAKVMRGMLENCKNLEFAENSLRILSALNDTSRKKLLALADEFCKDYKGADAPKEREEKNMKKYTCTVCGWTYDEEEGLPEEGIAPGTPWEELPEDFVCPLCGVDKEQFEEA